METGKNKNYVVNYVFFNWMLGFGLRKNRLAVNLSGMDSGLYADSITVLCDGNGEEEYRAVVHEQSAATTARPDLYFKVHGSVELPDGDDDFPLFEVLGAESHLLLSRCHRGVAVIVLSAVAQVGVEPEFVRKDCEQVLP